MSEPEIALLLSTYQRPAHLRWSLESIALQEGVAGRMELVVTDDGSTDETPRIVADFARRVDFPVHFATHEHTTFRLARCRNEGVAASRAPYLLFLDGDCILPRDHVRIHLARRKRGVVMAGNCCRLDEEPSSRLTIEAIRTGEYRHWAAPEEIKRLRKLCRSARFYQFIRHPTKPKLVGNNVGIWRCDYERVNGYDENFEGWGYEDDDLRYRLRRAGVRIETILGHTHTFHIWHPIDVTAPRVWRNGAKVPYLLRKGRLIRCRNGLNKRTLEDLSIRVVGGEVQPEAQRMLRGRFDPSHTPARPEVEILFLPGEGRFSGRAECNLLVALDDSAQATRAVREAHLAVTPRPWQDLPADLQFRLDQFEQALDAVA